MNIGIYDVDSHNFPNLPLMKISAYHNSKGDTVEWAVPLFHYDRVYVSRVFGDTYSKLDEQMNFQADEIIYGGTGFAIKDVNGKEIYQKRQDAELPYEIEHIYPDYSLYPKLTEDTAYGFLTRGCPNNCGFCIISKKEGIESKKVADLSEFWKGQKIIKLLDANILACKDREELLEQLIKSKSYIDFTQGLDARFIDEKIAGMLKKMKIKRVHFAFDLMRFKSEIIKGLKTFIEVTGIRYPRAAVYILTNYNTTFEDDYYRIKAVRELGFDPDVRIYRKPFAPRITKDLQRWCNNRFIYRACDFMDYIPRSDGKTIKEIYFKD